MHYGLWTAPTIKLRTMITMSKSLIDYCPLTENFYSFSIWAKIFDLSIFSLKFWFWIDSPVKVDFYFIKMFFEINFCIFDMFFHQFFRHFVSNNFLIKPESWIYDSYNVLWCFLFYFVDFLRNTEKRLFLSVFG